jgi:hypothetical protein
MSVGGKKCQSILKIMPGNYFFNPALPKVMAKTQSAFSFLQEYVQPQE